MFGLFRDRQRGYSGLSVEINNIVAGVNVFLVIPKTKD